MLYESLVEHAQKLLEQIKVNRIEIAKIALQVCEISHGGISGDKYTLSKFADDIGMKRRTLSNWVELYRDIILKVGIVNPSEGEWEQARITGRLLKHERELANKALGNKGRKILKNSDLDSETVSVIFEKAKDSREMMKLERLYATSKHVRHLTSQISISSELDVSKLEAIFENLTVACEILKELR